MTRRATDVGRMVFLVHAKCADGLTSAGLLLHADPAGQVEYVYPAELRAALERLVRDATLRRLVLADLSPQTQDLAAIVDLLAKIRGSAAVTWIDHHAPQWPLDFEREVKKLEVEVVLDRTETESGASLVAKWTKEKHPGLRRVADLIRRRDAWVEPHNPEARAWTLVAADLDAEYVERLRHARLEGLEERGKGLLAEQENSIEKNLREIRSFSPGVAYLWGEDDLSDVADRLFQRNDRVVVLLRFGPSRRVSIRSRAGRPVAAPLAQRYGGGGHANAAGFSLPLGGWRAARYRVLRARDPAVREALQAADRVAAGANA